MIRIGRVPVIVALSCLFGALACERDGAAQSPQDGTAPAPSAGVTAGPNYTINHPNAAVTVAEAGHIELRVTPAPGFKVNTEYPWELTLTASEPVALPQTEWGPDGATALTDEEAVYQVPVTVETAGDHSVDGHLRFSICNEARCDVLQAELAWSVTAE